MTKYLVVDVDGVLNSMLPTAHSFKTTGTASNGTFPLNLDKRHAVWLTDLAKETSSELIWGTTWQDDANSQIGAQIGLPDLYSPDFGMWHFRETSASWKSRGVLKYVGSSPFVWFDDDYELKYFNFKNGHIISVDEYKGLTEENIEDARKLLLEM